ncbi:hypothetical protein ACWFMI_05315 [Nocardiopsis terrae]
MRELRGIDADTVWRLLSWAGTGAVLGGALVLTSALVLSPAEWDGASPLHWGLCGAVVLLALVWTLRGGGQRPGTDEYGPRPGEGSGPIRAAAVLVLCLALQVALRERPGARDGAAGTEAGESGAEHALPDVLGGFALVSHFWFLGALALLVGAGALAISGRPEPLRPAAGRPRRQALLSGLVPVVALVVLAVPAGLEGDRVVHTLAEPHTPVGDAALESGDEVAWVWEHPEEGSAGEAEVVATGSGALVLDNRGVWALDSRDGAERWRFQPIGEVLWSDVTFDGERVAVLYRDDSRHAHQRRSLAVLETDTGKLVGDHRIHRKVESVLLTSRTFVQVEEGGFTVRAQEPGAEKTAYRPEEGCGQAGEPVVAGPRILVPEECVVDGEEREGGDEPHHEVRILLEDGSRYGTRALPGPVEELAAAPDGWAAVVRYGGDEPGSFAFQGRSRNVIAEDLPTGAEDRARPVDGELLLYTETGEGGRQVEYRLVKPVVGVPEEEVPDTETLGSFVFTAQLPDPGSVAVSPELFAAVRAGGHDTAVLLVGEWGSQATAVPLDTATDGLSPDGSPFGVALAPDAIVVSGFSAGNRAHVIGVGPGDES